MKMAEGTAQNGEDFVDKFGWKVERREITCTLNDGSVVARQ